MCFSTLCSHLQHLDEKGCSLLLEFKGSEDKWLYNADVNLTLNQDMVSILFKIKISDGDRKGTQIKWKEYKKYFIYIFYSLHLYFSPPGIYFYNHILLLKTHRPSEASAITDILLRTLQMVFSGKNFSHSIVKELLCKFHLCLKLSTCEHAGIMDAKGLKKKSHPSGGESYQINSIPN